MSGKFRLRLCISLEERRGNIPRILESLKQMVMSSGWYQRHGSAGNEMGKTAIDEGKYSYNCLYTECSLYFSINKYKMESTSVFIVSKFQSGCCDHIASARPVQFPCDPVPFGPFKTICKSLRWLVA